MIYIILGIVALLIFLIVRGVIRSDSYYQVFNSNGTRLHTGKYNECVSCIKSWKDMEKLSGTKDRYYIKRMKSRL